MLSSRLPRIWRKATGAAATAAGVGMAVKHLSPVAQAESPSTPPKIFGQGPAFFSLPLDEAEMVNHNTRRLRFRFDDEHAVSGLPLTSSVLTFSWPKENWLPVVRPYTPISSSEEPGHVEFLVKQYPGGKASTHLHSLQPGERLFFVASLSGHQWKANSYPHVMLIAGGAGITPIYQLTQGILNNPEDKTAVTVVFGVNSDRDVLMRREFDEYERKFPGRFKVIYTASNPVQGSPYQKGYVTKGLLETAMPSQAADTKVFVCGPPAMEESLLGQGQEPGVLGQLGFRKDQIYKF